MQTLFRCACGRGCGRPKKCTNCARNHSSDDSECPERKRRERILQMMKANQIPYTQAEESFPKTSNRFEILVTVSEEDSDQPDKYTTQVPASQHRGKRRKSPVRYSVDVNGDVEEENSVEGPPKPTGRVLEDNPYSATEFERFVSILRKLFLSELRAISWLEPLRKLDQKIRDALSANMTKIDTDHLLIEISGEIKTIIDDYTCTKEKNPLTRIEQNENSCL